MLGIATQLATIPGLNVTAFKPAVPIPPHAYVSIPEIIYHEAFHHGTVSIKPTVTIIIPVTVDRIDQPTLAAYADPTGANSIHSAIEADRTLGNLPGTDCIVVDFKEADALLNGVQWPAGVFTLKVTANGG